MTQRTRRSASAAEAPDFTPVPVRHRADGWTPARQIAFIHALGEGGCVDEACRAVGMSTASAYLLRRRPEAASFRQAWSLATDYAVARLADAVLGRAIHGTVTPVFYKGEQVGERRVYDERLAMFLLRARDPEGYGAWRDKARFQRGHPDGAARTLGWGVAAVAEDAEALHAGRTPTPRAPIPAFIDRDDPLLIAAQEEANRRREDALFEQRMKRLAGEEDAADDAFHATVAAQAAPLGPSTPPDG